MSGSGGGAVSDVYYDGVMVCFGESERLVNGMAQIQRFKWIAVDGKSGRFGMTERHLAEWHTGAADKARDKQEYDVRVRARRGRKKLVRREGAYFGPNLRQQLEGMLRVSAGSR